MADGNQAERKPSGSKTPSKTIRAPRLPPPPPPPARPPRRTLSSTTSPEYPPRKESLTQPEGLPKPGVPRESFANQQAVVPNRGGPSLTVVVPRQFGAYPQVLPDSDQQFGAYQQAILPKPRGASQHDGAFQATQKSPEGQSAGASPAMQKSPEGASGGAKPKDKSSRSSFAAYVREHRSKEPLSDSKKKQSPRSAPERSRVSLNPAGRSDPSPRLPSSEGDSEDTPKKGLFKSFFNKAKDFFVKKPHYTQLEQGDEFEIGKSPIKKQQQLDRYTQFEDEASKSMSPPARYFLHEYQKSAKVAPLPSELESSGDQSEQSLDLRLTTSSAIAADAVSEHGSELSVSSECEYQVATEIAWPMISMPPSNSRISVAELESDLCNIHVNSPAEVHVAYSVTGHVTTCIRQTADAAFSNMMTVRIQPDTKEETSVKQETFENILKD